MPEGGEPADEESVRAGTKAQTERDALLPPSQTWTSCPVSCVRSTSVYVRPLYTFDLSAAPSHLAEVLGVLGLELGQELVALHRAVVYAGEIDPAPVVLHQGVAFSQEHRLGVLV